MNLYVLGVNELANIVAGFDDLTMGKNVADILADVSSANVAALIELSPYRTVHAAPHDWPELLSVAAGVAFDQSAAFATLAKLEGATKANGRCFLHDETAQCVVLLCDMLVMQLARVIARRYALLG